MNKTILIIDDEKTQRESLGGYLKKCSYEVHLAESGMQALKILNEITIDLVLTDFKMPDMNGMEILLKAKKKIRK